MLRTILPYFHLDNIAHTDFMIFTIPPYFTKPEPKRVGGGAGQGDWQDPLFLAADAHVSCWTPTYLAAGQDVSEVDVYDCSGDDNDEEEEDGDYPNIIGRFCL